LCAGGRCGTITCAWVSAEAVMNKPDAEFDYERYRLPRAASAYWSIATMMAWTCW
jgi:hypothetical protein